MQEDQWLLRSFIAEVRERWVMEDKRHAEHIARTNKIERKLDMYGTIYKLVKFTGAAILLVLTLKLGDISGLWNQIFNN